jgi:hypothetical protein
LEERLRLVQEEEEEEEERVHRQEVGKAERLPALGLAGPFG